MCVHRLTQILCSVPIKFLWTNSVFSTIFCSHFPWKISVISFAVRRNLQMLLQTFFFSFSLYCQTLACSTLTCVLIAIALTHVRAYRPWQIKIISYVWSLRCFFLLGGRWMQSGLTWACSLHEPILVGSFETKISRKTFCTFLFPMCLFFQRTQSSGHKKENYLNVRSKYKDTVPRLGENPLEPTLLACLQPSSPCRSVALNEMNLQWNHRNLILIIRPGTSRRYKKTSIV